MFTVDDLKTGYRVVLHNGCVGICLYERSIIPYIYGKNGRRLTDVLRLYNENDDKMNSDYAIEKVYGIATGIDYWILNDEDLLWAYTKNIKTKDMTIEEIENELGHKIRIVG